MLFSSLLAPYAAVDESVEMATPLFEYAGELGDTNALYTFAHLLKQGEYVASFPCVCLSNHFHVCMNQDHSAGTGVKILVLNNSNDKAVEEGVN